MPRLLLLAVPVLALAGAGTGLALRPEGPPPIVEEPSPAPTVTPPAVVVVDVAGAVARPGVVTLPAGARVIDALVAAGGPIAGADPSSLNRAAFLRDGTRIYVPRAGEVPPASSVGSDAEEKVNVNSASERDLESLPGVGPATAQRIVRSREERPFAQVEELQTRGLVSARVFSDIRDLVTTR